MLIKCKLTLRSEIVRYGYGETRLTSSAVSNSELKSGDDCEVFNEGRSDEEPSGWWPATVKLMKGEFFVVDYTIHDETRKNDIVSSERIRPLNRKYIFHYLFLFTLLFLSNLLNNLRFSGPLQYNFLHKITFQVPDDLREM